MPLIKRETVLVVADVVVLLVVVVLLLHAVVVVVVDMIAYDKLWPKATDALAETEGERGRGRQVDR